MRVVRSVAVLSGSLGLGAVVLLAGGLLTTVDAPGSTSASDRVAPVAAVPDAGTAAGGWLPTRIVSSSGTVLAPRTLGPEPAAVQDPFQQANMYDCLSEPGMSPYGYINRPEPNPHRTFYFTRGAYTSGMYGRGGSWSVDFPKADRQFLYVMDRTLGWDLYPCENPISLADPELRRFPFLYMLEVGRMSLTPLEVENFRNYLLAGGFAYIDDFWDAYEWDNFAREIRRVLPEYDIVDIPDDHMIFRIIYPIEGPLQVPSINRGIGANPAGYGECYMSACTATVRGIFDDDGRLMVLMTHNSDLGDAWEHAENPDYPFDRSNYAFSMAFNIIAYSMLY